jgi:glycosyltransferase involved in cell wall biosynthesis
LPRALPHVAVLHSADLHALSRLPARSWWAQRIAACAGALVFVCQAHRERFASWLPAAAREGFGQRAHVQPMGFELPVLGDRERARRALGMQGPTLLSLGRLVPVKGLVEAVEALADQSIDWWIAGEGPERARIERAAATTGARVRLLGHVHGAHKRALLSAADAFAAPARVLASGRSEGMPTAVLEAMAHGLPVIAADAGGMGDLIEDGRTGLLTTANDVAAFARAVQRLTADAALRARLGNAAREAAAPHAWPRIAPRIEAWLHAASGQARAIDARPASVAATS